MKITNKPNTALIETLKTLNKKKLNVGWFESSKYEDGMPVAQVAIMNEFGSVAKNKPPRPFMRNAISDNENRWSKTANQVSKNILKGQSIETGLNLLGVVVESDVKKSIVDITSPALAQSTINARKSRVAKGRKIQATIEKPLIDTGYMLATLTSEVK